jgi:hypothetical protein
MEQQDFCKNEKTHSNQTSDREIERVRQSEMEMIEAKRERDAAGVEMKGIEVR